MQRKKVERKRDLIICNDSGLELGCREAGLDDEEFDTKLLLNLALKHQKPCMILCLLEYVLEIIKGEILDPLDALSEFKENCIAVTEISSGSQRRKTSMRKNFSKQPNAAKLLRQSMWKDPFKDVVLLKTTKKGIKKLQVVGLIFSRFKMRMPVTDSPNRYVCRLRGTNTAVFSDKESLGSDFGKVCVRNTKITLLK